MAGSCKYLSYQTNIELNVFDLQEGEFSLIIDTNCTLQLLCRHFETMIGVLFPRAVTILHDHCPLLGSFLFP